MRKSTLIILSIAALTGLGAGLGYSQLSSEHAQIVTVDHGASPPPAVTTSEPGTMQSGKVSSGLPAADPPPPSGGGGTISAPEPASLADLIRSSDAVVVGTVGSHVTTKFYGYDPDAARRQEIDRASGGSSLAVPATDYDVAVERVLLDDGRVDGGSTLTLRIIGDPQYEKTMPTAGSRRLLFLNLNPDGSSYGMSNHAADIVLDSRIAFYRDGAHELLPFGLSLTPQAFIEHVARTVEVLVSGT